MFSTLGRFNTGTLWLVCLLLWGSSQPSGQSTSSNPGEWRYYGADAAGTKYSPLDQINKDNVKDLRIAWRWKTENFGSRPDFNYEATPLMIGGVLYTTAGSRRDVVAIDGATGETLWMYRYDEGVRGQRAPNRTLPGRGLAYWTDGRGDERLIYVSLGYHLVELNPKTGRPIPAFGQDGVVDLYEGLEQPNKPPVTDGQLSLGSPPAVVGDVVVIGAALGGGPDKEFIAGFPRGFDVRTGKRLWTFHTIPEPGEFGSETWEKDSWAYTGHTGVWAAMSVDEELGYVYLGVESPTNDFYGGHRPGNNLFGNSLICLDAKTGKRIWHFQLTHHELWDYDIPAGSQLLDIMVDGKRIKAVAQVTKQAFTYVLDRVTGQPVWPIVEKPVPQSDVPGEKSSPTQPFPTKPPAFDRQGITLDDLIDFTPEIKAEAIKIASQYKLGPLYTPPIVAGQNGLRGVLGLPHTTGGANWQSGAVDPETGILYVASVTNPTVFSVVKDQQRSKMDYVGGGGNTPPGAQPPARFAPGAPPPEVGCGQNGPGGLPLVKPPWGRIVAIDLNKGEQLWMVPNGDTPDCVKNHPLLKGVNIPRTGQPERSGIMVTKTLVFAGEGAGLLGVPGYAGAPMFRAYDKQTGAVVWEFKLPQNQSGIPMSYMVNGKQYIVLPTGARNQPAELVALTLP